MDWPCRIVIEEHMHDACWGLSGSLSASGWKWKWKWKWKYIGRGEMRRRIGMG